MSSQRGIIRFLGPGILFASTAIGVSHLVQSTRAGAEYGYALIWIVVLANVLKFPFFEFGTRYAGVKRRSLLDGYAEYGKWLVWAYVVLNLLTMFTVTGAVTIVAAGLLKGLLPFDWSVNVYSGILFVLCLTILGFGRYASLDRLIKGVALVLLLTTITAFAFSFFRTPASDEIPVLPDWVEVAFMVSLMGWMPTALDISVWSSIWTVEKNKTLRGEVNVRSNLTEFNFGYWGTAVLALFFLVLGARVAYTGSAGFPDSASAFSLFLINLYAQSIGEWSKTIIAVSAFSVMFGTVIAVIDGYGRSMAAAMSKLFGATGRVPYLVWMVLTIAGGMLVITVFGGSLKFLVNLATILSFLVAPFIAVMNTLVVTNKRFPKEFRPGRFLRLLSITGILFLTAFSIYFLFHL